MPRLMRLSAGLGLAAVLIAIVGCGEWRESAPFTKVPPAAGQPEGAGAPQGAMGGDATAQKGLAQLSPEDRAAAEKQKVCPVSGEVLGAMGKPYKVHIRGRDVFLCCPGCEEAIQKEPDKYLAKLPPAGQ